ncbi:tetratricopeptide repeat protein [Capillimicrobium parvum]|uniref:Tetratricopeptide repeat protein n=1 Tax=Capillimicrobium parvum TaxID=2884022 RepID=A0A9E7C2K7_9ACTN|nr:tetratricopeptide repeat protein [Capillimicrobium parvum]UGS38551.1 hypothetical protein DSM104329_04981 [Capillimicrobium parvum]
MTDYFDLGDYGRGTSTSSPDAQRWFDRGLVWSYAFNHGEAIRCFEAALEHDPTFALAHWGVAYAAGPNYNKPWEAFDETDLAASLTRAHRALGRARELQAGASPVERDLIAALSRRYAEDDPAGDLDGWCADYAEAMRGIRERYPDDLDVATLCAEALMNLTAWALWDQSTGEPAEGSCTVEARAILERARQLPGGRTHPGVLHMYLHLMEMSPAPELALEAADDLRGLVPDAGHLEHMPTHIDILCGDYRRTVESNTRAIAADEKYFARSGGLEFYSLYRCHDFHFKIYGAMFLGQSRVALETADALAAALPEALLRVEVPPMADWLEGFYSMKNHVLIRFGRWQDILDLELPSDQDLYCVTTAMTRYARGVALAATGRVDEARAERERFADAVARVPESRTIFNNTCVDILAVASAMLDGEIAYRAGHHDEAFGHLRRSIELDDGLPYDEPWGWMQPTRHAYGALLLEQGRVEEAEAVYQADLGLDDTLARACHHPNNVWSLHGYHECLVRLGKAGEARIVKQQLDIAAAYADIPVKASCACRLTAVA